jgi:O-antigen/teichoic acid export membrane protein
MLRAFVRDGAIYAIPSFLSRGLSLVLVPLYTRVLNPSDYGALDLFMTFAGVVNLTIALEVSQGVARFYASEPDPQRKVAYASSALWFTIAVYTLFATAMLALPGLSTLIMGQSGLDAAFKVGIVYIWINSVYHLIQNQFRWELRSRDYAVTSILMTVVTASVAVMLTVVLRWGLVGLLVGSVAGSAAATCMGLFRLRTSFRAVLSVRQLKQMLAFSTPLVVSGIAVWLNTYVDRLVIRHYLTIDDVGLYGVGYRIASIAGLVMVGFQGALTPLVYAHFQKPDTPWQLARVFRCFLAVALTVFLTLTLFAHDILQIMTTPAYFGGAVVVIYLVPVAFLANMYIFSPGIGIAKKTHLLVWINVGGGLLNLVLNLVLVPQMGITGAGLSSLIAYTAVFGLITVMGQRLYHVPHRFGVLSAAVITAAVLATCVPLLPLDGALRWLANAGAIFLFGSLAFTLGLVKTHEIRRALSMVRHRLGADRGAR